MEFKQLRSLVAVAKYGSFTKAAEHLYLSQPTISTHIRTLEEELGQPLILRTTKCIEVTRKGQEICAYAASILELRERIERACRPEEREIVHLGASTIPSAYLLPELLPQFGQQYPNTYFVIHQSDSQKIVEGLADGIFDIGLVGMYAESEILECRPFFQDRLVLVTPVAPRFLALQQQPQTSVEELLREPVILRETGSGTNKSASRYLESLGIAEERLRVIARVNDQETVKNLVAGGLGVSIISEKAARNFVLEKRLLAFDLPDSNARTLYLCWRKGGAMSRQIQAFRTFVLQRYRSGNGAAGGLL